MPYALAAGDVAGAVVTIVKDGKVLVVKGYGYADVKKRSPVDPQTTLFRQASVSKLFTATAVMQWVEAGSTPAYSNYGVALAGYIVERVSGQPFEEYVEQRIFQPLGMRYSTFRQPLPKPLAPYMAQGYRQASTTARPFEILGRAPPGALSASGADMARFMLAHLNRGELNGRRILAAETADRMHDTPTDMIPPLS
ncbi:MAG: serine hydrolase domain-containing protein, partial [Acidimicrobiia bacterium]